MLSVASAYNNAAQYRAARCDVCVLHGYEYRRWAITVLSDSCIEAIYCRLSDLVLNCLRELLASKS